jgi:hypothetical protein
MRVTAVERIERLGQNSIRKRSDKSTLSEPQNKLLLDLVAKMLNILGSLIVIAKALFFG